MMTCADHPDREARLFCERTGRWFCAECGSACRSPKTYCRFRTACIIWALSHDRTGSLSPAGNELG